MNTNQEPLKSITKHDKTVAGQENLNDEPSQIVAVYCFVSVDREACIDDDPEHGI